MSQPNHMRIGRWRPVANGGSFRGFADVSFPSTFTLNNVGLHADGSKRWVRLPRAPVVIRGCEVKQVNGKPIYEPICGFDDHRAFEAFQSSVLEALDRDFPNAFGGAR